MTKPIHQARANSKSQFCPKKREEIRSMRRAGVHVNVICEKLGVSRGTVYNQSAGVLQEKKKKRSTGKIKVGLNIIVHTGDKAGWIGKVVEVTGGGTDHKPYVRFMKNGIIHATLLSWCDGMKAAH